MNRFMSRLLMLLVLMGFTPTVFAEQQELIGAGATFPYPLYSKMFDVYGREYGVKVNYQAIGSGGAIRQLINKTIDFGGSDAVMNEEDIRAAKAPILHIPICAGAVTITYNLPGNPGIKLTPELVADIFLGKVTRWNDPRILSANQGTMTPDLPIAVVHRSDGSGTTFILSCYLSKMSTGWRDRVGRGTALNWPTGLGAKGNPGVAALVKQIPGSIGYMELIYALQNRMTYAAIKNRKGIFVSPSIASTKEAMNINLPADMMVSLIDTDAAKGYPLAGFTWILVYKEQSYGGRSDAKAKELTRLLWWMTHEGQKYAQSMKYAPLSGTAVVRADALIRSVTYNGAPLMK
jgi:phosphate transport system substrate-binding protein